MAGLARSTGNSIHIYHVDNKHDFIKSFNAAMPSQEFFDTCAMAGELFNGEGVGEFIDREEIKATY